MQNVNRTTSTAVLTAEEKKYFEAWNSMSASEQDAFINVLHDYAQSPECKEGFDCYLYCMRTLGPLDEVKRDFLYYSWFKIRDGLPNPVIGNAINEINNNSNGYDAEIGEM